MTPTLLAVPNVSEGRDGTALDAIGVAFTARGGARLLDLHVDPDHHRAVYTLAGAPGALAGALVDGAAETVARVDLRREAGVHPHVGAVDVVPLVYARAEHRGAACAEALVTADELARRLGLPVFLYGDLADGRTRAALRRGGLPALTERMLAGELRPDFGPRRPHKSAGAVLVAARPPLVAFNLVMGPRVGVEQARAIAARLREGGGDALPGVRAIGLPLASRDAVQLSFNVENPHAVSLARLVAAVRRHADVASAELVGLAPAAAFADFPTDLTLPGFDPERHLIENVLSG